MALPAVSRAFWSRTIHCKVCKKPRPFFLAASKSVCKVCSRKKNREKIKNFRDSPTSILSLQKAREKDRVLKATIDPALSRCRNNYYKICKRRPSSVPKWVRMDDILPIYRYAATLDAEHPMYRHEIEHIYPLGKDKNVCGLHVLSNMRIRRVRI